MFFIVEEKALFIIYYWDQTSLKMDSAEIVFAEVQQVIGKTGKYSDLWNVVIWIFSLKLIWLKDV